ncbi:MAG: zinc ribbon domain-containing protein [Nitrospirae bacterium]|nr:zinc ribbon domain-containing protein [Nitrospirota bacterium]
MPIYEYQCEACAERFEIKQGMKDDPLTVCPQCGKRVQRLISSPAIMFKGSGWYVTDYSDKLKPSPDNEAPASTPGEKKEPAPGTSEHTTSTAPSTPASATVATPASTPASTTSGTSSTATAATTPPSSTTK